MNMSCLLGRWFLLHLCCILPLVHWIRILSLRSIASTLSQQHYINLQLWLLACFALESRVPRYSLISMASMLKLSSDLSELHCGAYGPKDFGFDFSSCFVTAPSQILPITDRHGSVHPEHFKFIASWYCPSIFLGFLPCVGLDLGFRNVIYVYINTYYLYIHIEFSGRACIYRHKFIICTSISPPPFQPHLFFLPKNLRDEWWVYQGKETYHEFRVQDRSHDDLPSHLRSMATGVFSFNLKQAVGKKPEDKLP